MAFPKRPIPPKLTAPITVDPAAYLPQGQSLAAQAAAPAKGGLRRQKKQLRREYRHQVQAAKGAAQVLRNAIDAAHRDLQAQGLTGQTLANAMKDLAAEKVDSYAWARFSNLGARHDFQDARSKVNDQLTDVRTEEASKALSIATDLASEKEDALQSIQGKKLTDFLETRRADRKEAMKNAGQGGVTDGQANALATARTLYNGVLQMNKVGHDPAGKPPPPVPKSETDWRLFALEVASRSDKSDQRDALWAVQTMRSKIGDRAIKTAAQVVEDSPIGDAARLVQGAFGAYTPPPRRRRRRRR